MSDSGSPSDVVLSPGVLKAPTGIGGLDEVTADRDRDARAAARGGMEGSDGGHEQVRS